MHEMVTAALAPTTMRGTLADLPTRNAAESPDAVGFRVRQGSGWSERTWQQFADDVAALAKGFVAAGVVPGSAIGILSRTRYEWTVVDFALWTAGAVPVPIYETSSPDQIAWILANSGAVGVVAELDKHVETVEALRAGLPGLAHVWSISAGDLATLASGGSQLGADVLATARSGRNRASVATIIYTSGTTGRPKGVELTHGNFLDLAENAADRIPGVVRAAGASTLLFLPLAHVFARFVEVLCLEGRVVMGHSADITHLLDDFAAFQPTFVLAVPRVFEKIYNSAEAGAMASGRGKIFAAAAQAAIAWSQAQDTGGPSFRLRAKHALFDRLVFTRLRAAMGGQIRYAVSGGAPLGTRLGHFYRGIGVTILEGYGLTETAAPATVNLPDRLAIGTVGPPLPGVGVRIAEDGEILLRGIGIFRGYHDNPEATAEAITDNWFHTGDIGMLDADGNLKITGRKKEILVTAGGKNVAPAVLEDRLRAHPLISQCIVVGDGKPFIAALITLDPEMLPRWGANRDLPALTVESARRNPVVLAEIQRAVDDANTAVSKAESIRTFEILDVDFTEEAGYLTPSLKLKRNVVMNDFADEVDALYHG